MHTCLSIIFPAVLPVLHLRGRPVDAKFYLYLSNFYTVFYIVLFLP
jgi:hypothetical protein